MFCVLYSLSNYVIVEVSFYLTTITSMAKKFAVVIRKGGSGKTTTTTNLAAGLHQKGDRVLLVDIDSQANATKGVGLIPEDLAYTLNDVFAGRVGNVRDAVVTNSFGLHVLP